MTEAIATLALDDARQEIAYLRRRIIELEHDNSVLEVECQTVVQAVIHAEVYRLAEARHRRDDRQRRLSSTAQERSPAPTDPSLARPAVAAHA